MAWLLTREEKRPILGVVTIKHDEWNRTRGNLVGGSSNEPVVNVKLMKRGGPRRRARARFPGQF